MSRSFELPWLKYDIIKAVVRLVGEEIALLVSLLLFTHFPVQLLLLKFDPQVEVNLSTVLSTLPVLPPLGDLLHHLRAIVGLLWQLLAPTGRRNPWHLNRSALFLLIRVLLG